MTDLNGQQDLNTLPKIAHPWSVNPSRRIKAIEFLDILHELGLGGRLVRTRHRDYKRIFVTDEEGITVGRACIFQGCFSHVNWYGDGRPSKRSLCLAARLELGRVPTPEEWDRAFQKSQQRAQERYDAKVRWREEHPPPEGKHRKRLAPPNVYSGLYPDLLAEMRASDGETSDGG